MTLFLRDKHNITYADIECWVKIEQGKEFVEISVSIPIDKYSALLLSTPDSKKAELILLFDMLSELRGWLWEKYFMAKENTADEFDNVLKELRIIVDDVGKRFSLHRVED